MFVSQADLAQSLQQQVLGSSQPIEVSAADMQIAQEVLAQQFSQQDPSQELALSLHTMAQGEGVEQPDGVHMQGEGVEQQADMVQGEEVDGQQMINLTEEGMVPHAAKLEHADMIAVSSQAQLLMPLPQQVLLTYYL